MIYGVGTDLVNIQRMAALFKRHGDKALEHMLAPVEFAACRQVKFPERYLAKRFAAKEALAKALGTGLRAPVLLTAIGVINDELGKPLFEFGPELATWIEARRLRCHLSLSDERDAALAFVVVEQL